MNKTLIGILIAVAVLGVGGYMLLANPSPAPVTSPVPPVAVEPTMPPATPPVAPVTPPTPAPAAGTVKEFTILGSDYKFSPNAISVNKGDTVRVIFKNSGGLHDFRIDEFNVATKVIGTGAQQTVEFVADKAGQFQYYCSVSGHRQMGMWGTLTVK